MPKLRKLSVVLGIVGASLVLGAGVAFAWQPPATNARGGACRPDGTRGLVTWTILNLESNNVRSPATITDVHVTNNFATSAFVPQPIPNTGHSTASATTTVPTSFAGEVHLTYVMVWSGRDGSDHRAGAAVVSVEKCEFETTTTRPTTTTTRATTTSTRATTTTTLAITTTAAPTTTVLSTTTTLPPTTLAPTTTVVLAPPVSTVAPSTTTTRPTSTTSLLPVTGPPSGTDTRIELAGALLLAGFGCIGGAALARRYGL